MSTPRPIFISARVRSGSTMLWNIYHRLSGYRAFYQPCHDNLLAHIRYTKPMESHRGVDDYWAEYRPLLDELPRWHRPEFGITRMLLEVDEPWPELRAYIQFLLDSCDGDVPVLQFNAMCWRLPWLRRNFPEARIVHLWRDPRDSWLSMVRHLSSEQWDNPDLADAYDLLQWSAALAPHFPFLFEPETDTAYARVYYLWRLSRLIGDRVAERTISHGEIQADADGALRSLARDGWLRDREVAAALEWIEPTPGRKWAEVHPPEWFEVIERRCDGRLHGLGLVEHFGCKALEQIRAEYAQAWAECAPQAAMERALNRMLPAYSDMRGEVTRLLHEVRSREREPIAEMQD